MENVQLPVACSQRLRAPKAQQPFQGPDEDPDLNDTDFEEDDSELDPTDEVWDPLDLDEDDEAEDGGQKTEDGMPKRRRKPKAPKGEPTEKDLAALDATDWTAVKVETDALRQRLNGMGAVNLVAIEEYSELKQRYEFLRTQSEDLASAKAQLLKAIDDINRTSLEQFQVTFDQIRSIGSRRTRHRDRATFFNMVHDGLRQAQLARRRQVLHLVPFFIRTQREDAPAVLEDDGVRRCP